MHLYDSDAVKSAAHLRALRIKADILTFSYNGKSLHLDFDRMVREITE